MNETNRYNIACPDDIDLVSYKEGSLDHDDRRALNEHLLLCDDCVFQLKFLPWDTVNEMNDALAGSETRPDELVMTPEMDWAYDVQRSEAPTATRREPRSLKQVLDDESLEIGQIWRPKRDGILVPGQDEPFSITDLASVPHLVAITNVDSHEVVKVVPLGDRVEFARDLDVVFRQTDNGNPLGYDFLLQVWNQQEMLVENLECCLGQISESPAAFTARVENRRLDVLGYLAEIGRHLISNEKYSLLGLFRHDLYADPAMRYRAREFETTAYLRGPVSEFRAACSVEPARISDVVEATGSRISQVQSPWLEKFLTTLDLTRLFSPAFSAAGEDTQENIQTFFQGRLLAMPRFNEYGYRELILNSSDAAFSNQFILMRGGSPLLVLLSSEYDARSGAYSAVVKITDEYERTNTGINESMGPLKAEDVSRLFDEQVITNEIITDSIASIATERGLLEWERIANSEVVTDKLSRAINEAIKESRQV